MYPKWDEKCSDYDKMYDDCDDSSMHSMPHMHKMDCDEPKKDYDMCCEMPKMPCKPERKCVKTFKCTTTFKVYRTCHYRLYKCCPRCGHEFDYHHHRGMCPRCD